MYFSSSEILFLPYWWLNETKFLYANCLLSTIIIAPEVIIHRLIQKPSTISL